MFSNFNLAMYNNIKLCKIARCNLKMFEHFVCICEKILFVFFFIINRNLVSA